MVCKYLKRRSFSKKLVAKIDDIIDCALPIQFDNR